MRIGLSRRPRYAMPEVSEDTIMDPILVPDSVIGVSCLHSFSHPELMSSYPHLSLSPSFRQLFRHVLGHTWVMWRRRNQCHLQQQWQPLQRQHKSPHQLPKRPSHQSQLWRRSRPRRWLLLKTLMMRSLSGRKGRRRGSPGPKNGSEAGIWSLWPIPPSLPPLPKALFYIYLSILDVHKCLFLFFPISLTVTCHTGFSETGNERGELGFFFKICIDLWKCYVRIFLGQYSNP